MDQSVTTNNRYAVLDNTNTASAHNKSATNTQSKQKLYKLPPLVAMDLNHNQIKSLMNTDRLNKFDIKYMSIATKIMFDWIEESKKHPNFFTSDIKSDKTIKFVLSGLHGAVEFDL